MYAMQAYQKEFLDFVIDTKVLCFGEFTLKSGRISPYFFNAGLFQTGSALSQLGRFYAQSIIDSGIEFDMLFGPAYKGIPLVSVTAAALYEQHGKDYPYAFNRKEVKDHGEGGMIVGAPLKGKVLVVDDVMTAGTAIHEAVTILTAHNAELAGVSLSLDRQEKGMGELSAVQEVEKKYGVAVSSIVTFSEVIHYLLATNTNTSATEKVKRYRENYGVF